MNFKKLKHSNLDTILTHVHASICPLVLVNVTLQIAPDHKELLTKVVAYRLDCQVLCSKIAPWHNSSPGLQNSSPEFQKSPFYFNVKGAILKLRGAI